MAKRSTFRLSDMVKLKDALLERPECAEKELRFREAFAVLAPAIHALRAKGYGTPAILEMLREGGVQTTAAVLKKCLSEFPEARTAKAGRSESPGGAEGATAAARRSGRNRAAAQGPGANGPREQPADAWPVGSGETSFLAAAAAEEARKAGGTGAASPPAAAPMAPPSDANTAPAPSASAAARGDGAPPTPATEGSRPRETRGTVGNPPESTPSTGAGTLRPQPVVSVVPAASAKNDASGTGRGKGTGG